MLSLPGLRFFRSDMAVIGFIRAWGFSFGQALAGLVIVAAALRESIPGRGLSRESVAAIVAAGLLLPFALLAATASAYDVGPAPGHALETASAAPRLRHLGDPGARRRRVPCHARCRCARAWPARSMGWAEV